MTREDIIKLAREAGVNLKDTPEKASGVGNAIVSYYDLKRFAALVAKHEREACALVCEERQEVFEKYYTKGLAAMCAEAIRARGSP